MNILDFLYYATKRERERERERERAYIWLMQFRMTLIQDIYSYQTGCVTNKHEVFNIRDKI